MDVLALAPRWGPGMWWPVFPAFWILFWVVLATLAFRARRNGWGPWTGHRASPSSPVSTTASAEQILAERYARGEMSSDEYFEHTSVLRGGVS
ncbi:hypothetical protein AB0M44_11360 [Streptosporangium subroseum]|uniref:SHOCT domain-containing protein n=1 Tax=Streptosporangium subroseum TaxID=106412 RepID=UPI003436CFCF